MLLYNIFQMASWGWAGLGRAGPCCAVLCCAVLCCAGQRGDVLCHTTNTCYAVNFATVSIDTNVWQQDGMQSDSCESVLTAA